MNSDEAMAEKGTGLLQDLAGGPSALARAALVLTTALLFLAPLLDSNVEYLLILCGGVTNIVAVIEISCQPFLAIGRKKVRLILTIQLVLLAVIIGSDVAHVMESDVLRLVLATVIILSSLLWAALTTRSANIRLGVLVFGIILSLGMYLMPALMSFVVSAASLHYLPLGMQEFMDGKIEFCAKRIAAWVHLIFIPIIYLLGDFFMRDHIPESRKALALDRQILLVGIACSVAGIAANDHLFEAGSSAVILLLGNWVYISYVHNQHTPPVETLQGSGATTGTVVQQ